MMKFGGGWLGCCCMCLDRASEPASQLARGRSPAPPPQYPPFLCIPPPPKKNKQASSPTQTPSHPHPPTQPTTTPLPPQKKIHTDKLKFRVRTEAGAQWTLAADEENEAEGRKWVETIAGAIAR